MYIVSPMTPVFFSVSGDMSGAGCRYMQTFASTDQIMIQVIARSESRTITGYINNMVSGVRTSINWKVWSMNSTDKLYYHVITGLADGYYTVEINGATSEPLRITSDDNELKDTTLIQYSMKDNRQRQDAVFFISDNQYFFDFRVPGGFPDEGWTFMVDNEQYTSDDYNIYEIYARERTCKTFVLGNAIGCPIWFGDLLNRILTCHYVYFDGNRFIRSESNVPEITQVIGGRRGFIFRQSLIDVNVFDYSENENLLNIRRVDDQKYRNVQSKMLTI